MPKTLPHERYGDSYCSYLMGSPLFSIQRVKSPETNLSCFCVCADDARRSTVLPKALEEDVSAVLFRLGVHRSWTWFHTGWIEGITLLGHVCSVRGLRTATMQ